MQRVYSLVVLAGVLGLMSQVANGQLTQCVTSSGLSQPCSTSCQLSYNVNTQLINQWCSSATACSQATLSANLYNQTLNLCCVIDNCNNDIVLSRISSVGFVPNSITYLTSSARSSLGFVGDQSTSKFRFTLSFLLWSMIVAPCVLFMLSIN